jgi:hypothetical protein
MRRSALLVTLLPALAGCGLTDPARLAGPALDTRALFPELAGRPERPVGGTQSRPDRTEPRTIDLAGSFVAELPAESAAAWTTASRGGATLCVRGAGGPPEALVYAEAVGAREVPGEDLRRFALTVDPALVADQLDWPTAATAWTERAAGTPGEVARLRRFAWLAATRTGGRGLGYTSTPGTFSGWRWIGRNTAGALLRLARTEGEWGGQPPLDPALAAELPEVVARFPSLAWLAGAATSDPWSLDAAPRQPVAAAVILVSADSDGRRLHLALLCARTPTCAAAPDLAHLLATLRPGAAESSEPETAGVEALAADLGITLAPQDWLLPPGAPPPEPAPPEPVRGSAGAHPGGADRLSQKAL